MTDQFYFHQFHCFVFTFGTIILEDKTWNDTVNKLKRIYLKL